MMPRRRATAVKKPRPARALHGLHAARRLRLPIRPIAVRPSRIDVVVLPRTLGFLRQRHHVDPPHVNQLEGGLNTTRIAGEGALPQVFRALGRQYRRGAAGRRRSNANRCNEDPPQETPIHPIRSEWKVPVDHNGLNNPGMPFPQEADAHWPWHSGLGKQPRRRSPCPLDPIISWSAAAAATAPAGTRSRCRRRPP